MGEGLDTSCDEQEKANQKNEINPWNQLPWWFQKVLDTQRKEFENSKRWKLFAESKKQTNEQTDALKKEVLPAFSPHVQEIVKEVEDMKFNYEPEWRTIAKTIAQAFKERNWSWVFGWISKLFTTLLWKNSLLKTKKNWNTSLKMNSRNKDKFLEKDMDWILSLCKKTPEVGKKNMYARVLAERKDAECEHYAQSEPHKTLDLLAFHAENWWIQIGDVINFAGESGNIAWNAKEAGIQTVVWSDWTHSAMITSLNPLEITHASSEWVNTIPLIDYLTKYKMITYSIIQWGGTQAANYAIKQKWKKYDAINWANEKFGDENEQFCSELTIRALWAAWQLPKDLKTLEEYWEVYPHNIFDLSYPKYVSEYPKVDV